MSYRTCTWCQPRIFFPAGTIYTCSTLCVNQPTSPLPILSLTQTRYTAQCDITQSALLKHNRLSSCFAMRSLLSYRHFHLYTCIHTHPCVFLISRMALLREQEEADLRLARHTSLKEQHEVRIRKEREKELSEREIQRLKQLELQRRGGGRPPQR